MDKPIEGWAWLSNATKWHYFRDSRSLCRRWMFLGDELESGKDNSPDNCESCKRALVKERAKVNKAAQKSWSV